MACSELSDDRWIVDRTFSRLEPHRNKENEARGEKENEARPLSAFFTESALVVLGEPGMGKTTCFIQSAGEEPNAEYLTIRQFLRLEEEEIDGLRGKTLYLDSLDEQRAGKGDGNDVLDDIIKLLKKLGRPKFRLSCRTADWFGESDNKILVDELPSGGLTVLRLTPLSEAQIQEIVDARALDGAEFLEKARASGIEEWVTNPQHLNMVLEVVSHGEAWPETRKELFERACHELVQEHNESHYRAPTGPAPSWESLLGATGLLCTLILRTNLEGVALKKANKGEGFPNLDRFPESPLPLRQAARTKLFRYPGPERAAYHHRTMAEYLAARYLVARMGDGLPAERVRRLLTSSGGKVPSHLRGLHAWVATLCPEPGLALFLGADPVGLVLFGDPASLSANRKGDLLDGFARLTQENPWYLDDYRHHRLLGRLADPVLKERLEAILKDWRNQENMLFTVLDMARWGRSLPVSKEVLLAFLHERDAPVSYRVQATYVFLAHCPESVADLKAVLVELNATPRQEEDQELRGVLAEALYPFHLTPMELVDHLFPSQSGELGAYSAYLSYVVEETPDDQLPALMEALAQKKAQLGRSLQQQWDWPRLVGKALARAMEQWGERIATATLYTWLELGTDDHGLPELHYREHIIGIREWLTSHPDIIKQLFLCWMEQTPADQWEENSYFFWERLQGVPIPAWFADWSLELVVGQSEVNRSDALFRVALRAFWSSPLEPPYPLERLFSFVEQNPRFEPNLMSSLSCDLQDYHWEMMRSESQFRETDTARKEHLIADLIRRIEDIRNGSDIGALRYLGQIHQGGDYDVDEKLPPFERISKKTSPDIAQAAEEGFVRCLKVHSLPTPQEIGEVCAKNRNYYFDWIVLAGMARISTSDGTLTEELPDAVLSSAIAFGLSMPGGERPAWFMKLMGSRPELMADSCMAFWLPSLREGNEHISNLHLLVEKEWSGIAHRIAMPLLEQCPNLIGYNLQYLLQAAVKWGDRSALRGLVSIMSGCREEQVADWPQWAALACLLGERSWPQIEPVLRDELDEAMNFFGAVLGFSSSDRNTDDKFSPGLPLPAALMGDLLAFYGEKIPPMEKFKAGIAHDGQDMSNIRSVHALINRLAGKNTSEASAALQSLVDRDGLSDWKITLRHALAQHRQMMADQAFDSLTWEAVFNVITGGAPATIRDLLALVVDQLDTIARELRDGRTDGYKVFWNTDGDHRTTDPKREDNSRDRLLEALQAKFAPLTGLQIEPEGRYADDKRADLKVLFKNWNIPIEIKQDDHDEVWKAAENQLIARYVRDPGTEGCGIYLVLWYGEHGKGLTKPPTKSITTPTTPRELEAALRARLPDGYHDTVAVKVLDVSTRKPARVPV